MKKRKFYLIAFVCAMFLALFGGATQAKAAAKNPVLKVQQGYFLTTYKSQLVNTNVLYREIDYANPTICIDFPKDCSYDEGDVMDVSWSVDKTDVAEINWDSFTSTDLVLKKNGTFTLTAKLTLEDDTVKTVSRKYTVKKNTNAIKSLTMNGRKLKKNEDFGSYYYVYVNGKKGTLKVTPNTKGNWKVKGISLGKDNKDYVTTYKKIKNKKSYTLSKYWNSYTVVLENKKNHNIVSYSFTAFANSKYTTITYGKKLKKNKTTFQFTYKYDDGSSYRYRFVYNPKKKNGDSEYKDDSYVIYFKNKSGLIKQLCNWFGENNVVKTDSGQIRVYCDSNAKSVKVLKPGTGTKMTKLKK